MKRSKTLLIAALCFIVINACKKDHEAPVNLGGTTWSDSAKILTYVYKPFTVAFNQDGTATVTFSGYTPFVGTWNKPANSQTVYFFFEESATNKWKGEGTLNNSNTKIENGVISRTSGPALSGIFHLVKQ
jgi:hypothetical protein